MFWKWTVGFTYLREVSQLMVDLLQEKGLVGQWKVRLW